MQALLALTPDELVEKLNLNQSFRGKQIFRDLHKNLKTIQEMTTLSKKLKSDLATKAVSYSSSIYKTQISKDGTKKLAFQLADGNIIESVLLSDGTDRLTACLSTQVGCAMGCEFCKTATMGLIRNLEAHEIIEQFYHLRKKFGEISNIVFMGMGEPLHNYKNVKKVVNILGHPEGMNFSPRRITVSTCGLGTQIRQLADDIPQVKLAVSLNTADEKKRINLMPVTKSTSLTELKESLRYFQQTTGKRFTLEYVLLPGENNSQHDLKCLLDFTRGLKCLVNLIPWNPSPGMRFQTAVLREAEDFKLLLERKGLKVTLRQRKGEDIDGACGQLASESRKEDLSSS